MDDIIFLSSDFKDHEGHGAKGETPDLHTWTPTPERHTRFPYHTVVYAVGDGVPPVFASAPGLPPCFHCGGLRRALILRPSCRLPDPTGIRCCRWSRSPDGSDRSPVSHLAHQQECDNTCSTLQLGKVRFLRLRPSNLSGESTKNSVYVQRTPPSKNFKVGLVLFLFPTFSSQHPSEVGQVETQVLGHLVRLAIYSRQKPRSSRNPNGFPTPTKVTSHNALSRHKLVVGSP